MHDQEQLTKILKQHFGFDSFYPTQLKAIQNILQGGDTIILMPTGGGKSLCYQLPALVMGGLTVVISPLIALMHDQVESLRANGISAAFLNSSLSIDEQEDIVAQIEQGEICLLYVSPERMFAMHFMEWLKGLPVRLFAIDEAHCISSWGHHFRPEYKQLNVLKYEFPEVPLAALTATADKAVRSDIGESLNMKDPLMLIDSFDRPNLSLAVLPGVGKWPQLLKILDRHPFEPGIIYCLSRKNTEDLSRKLREAGFSAHAYHAGMEPEDRAKVQNSFMQDEIKIVCATIAFGMGIDKSDIRFIVHYNMPGNLESYYQEIGRSGRDGKPAEAILFYSYQDIITRMRFIDDIQDPEYREILEQKLDRMREYAEAQICRRSILLSYFSQQPRESCGNCDVCHNPPKFFDGTIVAQKALSAIYRTEQQIPLSTTIDILRGVFTDEVVHSGYNKIKTFGVGRDVKGPEWHLYLQQLIQKGAIEIDYRNGSKLKLTKMSHDILFNKKEIHLVSFDTVRSRLDDQKSKAKKTGKHNLTIDHEAPYDDRLYDHLAEVRKERAEREGVPAFMIFGNKTLRDMARLKPTDNKEMLSVHGIGEYKLKKYGELFLGAISDFDNED